MRPKRSVRILATYVLSLLFALGLLVVWVVYVLDSGSRVSELAQRVGMSDDGFPWLVLVSGCALFFLLIGGLTYQLAQTLAERRYSQKQEEFISNITHEMKSPLAAIRLHAETLGQGDLSEADERRSIGFILQQSEQLGRLVDNVLESSRLTARKSRLELAPVDLSEVVASYLEEARVRARRQGVEIAAELGGECWVEGSADALHRVVDNLVDNAVRFSSTGGEVRLALGERDGVVRLSVEDDGVGIPKLELPRIFDRFYQAGRGTDGRRRGTGLGLSIVSELVREMRGEVAAFSHEGRPGTRFVVELPRLEAAA